MAVLELFGGRVRRVLISRPRGRVVDRQRPDFMSIIMTFKYLGFQLSRETVKDTRGNKMFALLRYDLQ